MQKIVSGTSTERVVRTLLLMLLIDGFTVAYLWDGYVGYARQNAKELVRLLGLPSEAAPPINEILTAKEGQRLAQKAKVGDELDVIESELTLDPGQPESTVESAFSLEYHGTVYFLGPGGWLKVQLTAGRIANVTWSDGPKTESDQQWQRWIGYVLAVAGLIVGVRLALVLSARLTLTEAGLQIGSRSLIPLDSITALRADPAGRSGIVEIEFSLGGRLQRISFDRYVFKRLPEIVAAICENKAFLNPWTTTAAARV